MPIRKIPKLYMMAGVVFVTLVALYMLFQTSMLLFIIGLLFGVITAAFLYIGYILTALVTKLAGITYTKGGYVFPPGQEVVLKRSNEKYLAAKFLLVSIPEREEVSAKSEERVDVYLRDIEMAMSAIKVPAKFNLVMSTKDITAYRESIQAKVYEYGLRIKREMEKAEPDVIKLDKWQKEKEVYENQLRRLASGVKPMAAAMYVMTVAKGVTPQEAMDKVQAYSKEIKAIVSNSLNAEVSDLRGEDAELCLEWERRIPSDFPEFLEMTV